MDLIELKQFATTRQAEIIDAVLKHGSQRKAAKALGINSRGLERMMKRVRQSASRQGWSPDHDMIHIAPDTHIVKGVSTFYNEDGRPIRQWVKTDLKKQNQEAALQAFADALMEDLPKYKPLPYKPIKDLPEQLTAYVIGDAHIGMLATNSRNRGDGEWNLEIAERVTLGAVEKLIKAAGASDTALMLDLGDFTHSDNEAGTTTKGTSLDVDGHFSESIAAAVRVYRQSISMMLATHNKVILMMVRGNHNSNTAIIINTMLKVFYEDEPRVEVLDNSSKFMSLVYGNVLLASHHGNRLKAERAYEYVTRSMAKEWGQCEHRHFLSGHIHHSTSKEIGGMTFEAFQALPAPDAWHSDSGYGAKRSMTCIVYDKQHGEIQRHKVGISQLEVS
jgi:hypothetical protein